MNNSRAIDLVNDDNADEPNIDILEQALQGRAVEVASLHVLTSKTAWRVISLTCHWKAL